MQRILTFSISCCLLLAAMAPLAAEEPKKDKKSPEDVVRRAMSAFAEDRIEDFAREMHPTALKQFKELLLSILKSAEADGQDEAVLRLFKGVRTVDDAVKLNDIQFFVSFLKGVMDLKPDLKNALAKSKTECLGHVMEGEDTAHVVVRMTVKVGDASVTKMDVISLKKTDSGWAMQLSGEFGGLVQSLKLKFGKEK